MRGATVLCGTLRQRGVPWDCGTGGTDASLHVERASYGAGTGQGRGLDERKRPVCEDEIASAGEPYALEVEIEEPAAKPDGERFELKANASDAFMLRCAWWTRKGVGVLLPTTS